jgi:hypothetical protein
MKKAIAVAVLLGLLGTGLFGVTVQKWLARTSDDLLKGKSSGVSISSQGVLSLAPVEESVEGPAEEFYLSLVGAPDGSLYLGTGHSGKVYKLSKDGKADLYFQAAEMDVTCLALDAGGTLYAGTSPNGKVYKVSQKGKGEVLYDPSEKYIWALIPGEGGNLLAAVGEGGGIYEITPQGDGRQILKVQENHILCLKRDTNGDLFAGSGGNGLLYRVTKAGKASVVFESPFEEIKSLDIDSDGRIIIGAAGNPTRSKKEDLTLPAATAVPDVEITVTAARPAAATPSAGSVAPTGAVGKEPSALFVVSLDGTARKIWSSPDELIYSVLWRGQEKRALVGTGGRGRVYSVDEEGKASLLVQKPGEQAYAVQAIGARVYILSNNPPRVDILLPEQRFEGEYMSSVLDAKMVSSWGRISWQGEEPQGTTLRLQTRSGNSAEPGPTWSEWSPPYKNKDGEPILSSRARFLQLRALFKTDSGRLSPRLQKISAAYVQTNVAPVVNRVDVLPPNDVYLKLPETEDVIWGSAGSTEPPAVKPDEQLKNVALAKKVERKGLQTMVWDADDENNDRITFDLAIRKESETAWHVLAEDWTEILYAFDTATLPDGVYLFRVTASDAPSNPQGLALKGEKISSPLVVDNTPPFFKNASATRSGASLRVAFQAEDALSPIVEARVFIRPGPWQVVFPGDGICDSKQESFEFTLNLPADADNLVVLTVKDAHGNVGVYRQSF